MDIQLFSPTTMRDYSFGRNEPLWKSFSAVLCSPPLGFYHNSSGSLLSSAAAKASRRAMMGNRLHDVAPGHARAAGKNRLLPSLLPPSHAVLVSFEHCCETSQEGTFSNSSTWLFVTTLTGVFSNLSCGWANKLPTSGVK